MFEKKYPLWSQILVGFIAAALEFLDVFIFVEKLKWPLYMDCVWTVASSFFGAVSGIICGIFVHIPAVIFLHHDPASLLFCICSLTVVLFTRLFVRYQKAIKPFALAFAFFVLSMTFAISLEGGILYQIAFEKLAYQEVSSTNSIVFGMFIRGIPLLLSGIMGRIPINLLDKLIACLVGFGIAVCAKGAGGSRK